MYAGLRLGELQALHGEDVDLESRVIEVRRGWDQYEGEQTPKSRAGERGRGAVRRLPRSGRGTVAGHKWTLLKPLKAALS
jgi:integrase